MTDTLTTLAIVVPCYNEEDVLPETISRLADLLQHLAAERLVAADSHVCFVDDGSRDRTWLLIRQINEADGRFAGLKLSRNRGHQSALLAGLFAVDADLVISIDADLQDDLGAIEPMLRAAAEGADIVYGIRRARTTDTAMKRWTAQTYYRLLHWLGVEIVYNHADFRLLSRRAIDALREYDESNLFLRALIPQLGFTTQSVYYERSARFAGESKYPLRKMIALAIEGVTSFSNRPLRIITVLGWCASAFAVLLSIWALFTTLVLHAVVPGWASVVIPTYLIAGVQLLCLGVIGEYVGKIYLETKGRPRYHVAQTLRPRTATEPP